MGLENDLGPFLVYTMVISNAIACPFRDRPLSVISDELVGVGVGVVGIGKIGVVIASFLSVSGQAVYESGVVVEWVISHACLGSLAPSNRPSEGGCAGHRNQFFRGVMESDDHGTFKYMSASNHKLS